MLHHAFRHQSAPKNPEISFNLDTTENDIPAKSFLHHCTPKLIVDDATPQDLFITPGEVTKPIAQETTTMATYSTIAVRKFQLAETKELTLTSPGTQISHRTIFTTNDIHSIGNDTGNPDHQKHETVFNPPPHNLKQKHKQSRSGTGTGNSVPHRKHTNIKDFFGSTFFTLLQFFYEIFFHLHQYADDPYKALRHADQEHAPTTPKKAIFTPRVRVFDPSAQIIAQLKEIWSTNEKHSNKTSTISLAPTKNQAPRTPTNYYRSHKTKEEHPRTTAKAKSSWIGSQDLTATNPIDRGPDCPLFSGRTPL